MTYKFKTKATNTIGSEFSIDLLEDFNGNYSGEINLQLEGFNDFEKTLSSATMNEKDLRLFIGVLLQVQQSLKNQK